jgi:hypothetical protein
MKIAIDEKGIITFIYTDELNDLIKEGEGSITRVSSVEPDLNGNWITTMRDGVILGPYQYRWQALEEEVKYLEAKLF